MTYETNAVAAVDKPDLIDPINEAVEALISAMDCHSVQVIRGTERARFDKQFDEELIEIEKRRVADSLAHFILSRSAITTREVPAADCGTPDIEVQADVILVSLADARRIVSRLKKVAPIMVRPPRPMESAEAAVAYASDYPTRAGRFLILWRRKEFETIYKEFPDYAEFATRHAKV